MSAIQPLIFLFKGLLLINLNWKSNVSLEFLITYSVFYSCEIFPYRILAYFRHSPRLKSLCQPQTILAQARWHNFEKCNTNLTGSKYHCLLYNFILITRCWWFDQLISGISMKIVMTLDACSLKQVHLDKENWLQPLPLIPEINVKLEKVRTQL